MRFPRYRFRKVWSEGYRNEAYGGSGVRDAEQVLRYEIDEMGNEEMVPKAAESLGMKKTDDLEAVIGEIHRRFGNDAVALWFATKTGVKRYGGNGGFSAAIPTGAVAVSNLGWPDGRLYVMSHKDWEDVGSP